MHSMKAGTVIQKEDISILRTEKILSPGISPLYMDTVTGKTLSKDVTSGAGLQWEDILK